MSEKYKIWDQRKAYFLTMTVVGWIDVFIRNSLKMTIVNSLKYCQNEKGLEIFGYCLMSSHLHLIARAENNHLLSDILRDFKKYTSKALIAQIQTEPESRRDLILEFLRSQGEYSDGKFHYRFWQEGNHAEEINTNNFFYEKLEYIHNNPVKALIVEKPEDYLFSSARNYAGLSNYLEITLESVRQQGCH
jgi:REP element-mobilizing transposase RayT